MLSFENNAKLTIIIVLSVLPDILLSWDLSVLKISYTYYASSVAVYKNRAFVAIPRSSCYNNISNPTLVEVPWASDDSKHGLFRKKMYPPYKEQRWGSCRDHQDVISLDVDGGRAKLWALDRGSRRCSPKIVIYNLHYNTIASSSKLIDIDGEKLSNLVIDPDESNSGKKAYVGGIENYILVFYARGTKLWKIKILNALDVHIHIPTNFLAISAKAPVLYLTGPDDLKLYSMNLTMLKDGEETNLKRKDVFLQLITTTIGEKLGPSSGLTLDSNDGLYYYMTRDYAVVRWNTSMPLVAEYHDVVMQTYETLPFVSQFFYGPKNSIWALVNPAGPETCQQSNGNIPSWMYGDLPKMKSRIVRILEKDNVM
ncbi:hypothetical protein Trydic_g19827 [Trypoxylus dichotomus]